MDKLEKQNELAKESVKLLKEFRKIQEPISDNIFNSIRKNKTGSKIIIDHMYEGRLEFTLDKINEAIEDEMEGFGPCGCGFDEAIEMAKDDAKDKYEKLSKKEFFNYIGNIYFIEFRCEEIYERLKSISKEASSL